MACGAERAAVPTSELSVWEAWARAADSGANAAVYFTLGNAGSVADTLKGVASEAAELTQMHISMQHNRTMHMSEVTALPVPADDSVQFKPLGAHVMLTRLRRPLVAGDTVVTTLTFVSGQTVQVRAGVRRP
ncbi:MAG: copper chaperone PCu(A)C [Gemmatimonadaceae bacterium]|nr:copper chaperone PCu(A)C [Gemmatimonadaceae bacterium]